jgi:hypothetical protein
MAKLSVIRREKTREKSPYLELSDVLTSPELEIQIVGLCRWLERLVGTPAERQQLAGIRLTSRAFNVSQTSQESSVSFG